MSPAASAERKTLGNEKVYLSCEHCGRRGRLPLRGSPLGRRETKRPCRPLALSQSQIGITMTRIAAALAVVGALLLTIGGVLGYLMH
jgi:hypothetical protein